MFHASMERTGIETRIEFGPLTGESRKYRGLGHQKTVGKRTFTFAIARRDGTRARGEIVGQELSHGEAICLLSVDAQAALGLVKDMRQRTATLEGVDIQLYRTKGTNLHAICITDDHKIFDKESDGDETSGEKIMP